MLPLLTALVLAAAPLQDTAHVVLVATTDVDGHATDRDYLADRPFAGGLVRVATVVDSLRARYPGQVVVMDAGDMLQGDALATYFARVAPTTPHPIVEAMNLAGYDVATPGDHDFDRGLSFLRRAVADARFPYVSANVYAASGRIRGVVLQGGHKLRPEAEYTLATDEGSAAGADGLAALANLRYERVGLLPQPVEASAPAGFLPVRP
jgi:2',3'-cyclic-nucleotide 2'-phosphodiesterase (5'-nucleotidase family)